VSALVPLAPLLRAPGTLLERAYQPELVALSILVAIVASYAALDLASRVTVSGGRARTVWLAGGSVAMGIGLWSMHFVGMLAFQLHLPTGSELPIAYDMARMAASVLVAVGAAALALSVASRGELGARALGAAAVGMGGAIAGMHYIGMSSLQTPAAVRYSPLLVALSLAIALVAALIALRLAFTTRDEHAPNVRWRRAGSAVVMGGAIVAVHYAAMAAASFVSTGEAFAVRERGVIATSGLAATVSVASMVILGLVLLGATVDRRVRAHLVQEERRRRQGERLRESQALTAAILESSFDAVVTMDHQGMVREFNAAAERMFGCTREEAAGRPFAELAIPPELREAHAHGFMRHLHAGETRLLGRLVELTALRRDGTHVPIELAVTRLPLEGAPVFAAFIRDITERRQAREVLQNQAAELERANAELWRANTALLATSQEAEAARAAAEGANRAKSDFLATISHELRTPLNAILGYTELMELNLAGPVSDRQRRYLERVRASGRHLLGLINEILDLAKIEAGRLEVRREPAPIDRAIVNAVTLVRPQAAARSLELVVGCARAPSPGYFGDETRVQQILANLLSNAVKFTQPGGRVQVECATLDEEGRPAPRGEARWLEVRVTDTGIGIPPEKLEAVFEPFVQVDSGHTRVHGGTGLGLAISRRLARLMDGELMAESRVGAGSVFTLRLPAAPEWRPTPARSHLAVVPGEQLRPAPVGLDAVAHALSAGTIDEIVRTFADRLRADPTIPSAREHDEEQLVDHTDTLLTDLARVLLLRARGSGAPTGLLRDSDDIQELIARRHGAQRRRIGWSEEALRREWEVLRQEIENVARRSVPPDSDGALQEALTVVRELLDRSEAQSLAGWMGAGE
jgi:PAS domain S-box-containing protein